MNGAHITLRQLRVFIAVARSGSTTAASGDVALSQSATSAALNDLERMLALRLFERSGKRLLLNENGRALLPRAQAVLDGVGGIERMAREPAERMQSLRIGASTTIGSHVVPKLLSRFFADEPRTASDWQSSVTIANTSDICTRVARFELDIGLIEGPCHEPSLDVRPWLRDEMVIVGAPSLAGKKLTLKDLRDAVWLLRESGSGTREATDLALLPHLRSYRRRIELGSSEAITRGAALGLGLACISRWTANELLHSGALYELRTGLPALSRQCYWVLHRDKQRTPTLQSLIEHLGRAGRP